MQIIVIVTWALMVLSPPMTSFGKKVTFVIPKQMRRSHTSNHHFSPLTLLKAKSILENKLLSSPKDFPYLHHDSSVYLPKERVKFTPGVFHGGDDFDQGHEPINNIVIPHGKGITHAITFGKGYVPHEALYEHFKFSPLAPPPQDSVPHLTYHQALMTENLDSLYHNFPKKLHNENEEVQERKTDAMISKFFPEKIKPKGINKSVFNMVKKYNYPTDNFGKSGGLFLSQREALHQALGGEVLQEKAKKNKEKINFSDIKYLEEYNKKLMDLTKNWPAAFYSPQRSSALSTEFKYGQVPSSIEGEGQQVNKFTQYLATSESADGSGWLPVGLINQERGGYAVTENIEDISPSNFGRPLNVQLPLQYVPESSWSVQTS